MRSLVLPAAVALAVATLASPARALMQPDGTVIPVGGNLVGYLNAQGETIDPLVDAATTPETFTPGCALTFTVLARGGSQKNSFGWYNVTGSKPAFSDLVEFIGCNDGVGTVKVLDIRNHPRYTGGDVGFIQATTQGAVGNCVNFANPTGTLGYVFYSEKAYNDDNMGPNSFIHLLIMDSKVIPNAFYFGWEDLFSGGDNDFEDLLMRVEGIQCAGGGEECDTGALGECSFGATQCVNGVMECVQRKDPIAESCNGLDDDCNGTIDEGDLCPPDEICDKGTCVGKCGSGEFACPPGLVCRADGFCVDPACEMVTCPVGQVCVGGTCQGPCDGVVCPHGQVCRAGACVDPCTGVMCEADQYCDNGVCITKCSCGGCSGTKVCDVAREICVEPGCEGVSCAASEHCESGGSCIDDCAGAQCPSGQKCEGGACVDDGTGTGGSAGTGGGGSGGTFVAGGTGGATGGTAGGSAGSGADGAGGSGVAGTRGGALPAEDSSCGCRVPGGRAGDAAIALLALLACIGVRARRRR